MIEIGGLLVLLVLIAGHFVWSLRQDDAGDVGDTAAAAAPAIVPAAVPAAADGPLSREPLSDDGLLQGFDALGIDVTSSEFQVSSCGDGGIYRADHSDSRDGARIALSIPTAALWPEPRACCTCKYIWGHIALSPAGLSPAADSAYLRGLRSSSKNDPAQMILVQVYPMAKARFRHTVELIQRNHYSRCLPDQIEAAVDFTSFACGPARAAFHLSGVLMAMVASNPVTHIAADGRWIAGCRSASTTSKAQCRLWFWQDGAAYSTTLATDDPAVFDAMRLRILAQVEPWVR